MGWYRFKDASKQEIVAYLGGAPVSPDSSEIWEELVEDDPRVQEYLGPPWAREGIQFLEITSVEDLLIAYRAFGCSAPKFAFRGQADYSWPLQSNIERNRDSLVAQNLEVFENRVLIEAQRRGHLYASEVPGQEDLLAWLGWLRHFGVPTRLLDITWSIYVAAFFAVEEGGDRDACIWVFNQTQLTLGLHSRLMAHSAALFRHRTVKIFDAYQPPSQSRPRSREIPVNLSFDSFVQGGDINSDLLLEFALRGGIWPDALLLVEPHWMTRRMEMQQGAFLFPLRIDLGFMRNLYSSYGVEQLVGVERSISGITDKEIATLSANTRIAKLRIRAEVIGKVRHFLEATNVRRLVLYPDMDGFAGYLKDIVPRSTR